MANDSIVSWRHRTNAHTGEYRPDLSVNIVKGVADKASVGKTDTFGSTVPRFVAAWCGMHAMLVVAHGCACAQD